jgi:hypothetical protein
VRRRPICVRDTAEGAARFASPCWGARFRRRECRRRFNIFASWPRCAPTMVMPGRSHTGHASWLTTDKPRVTADVAREQLLAAEVDRRRGRAFPVYTMRIVQGPRQWPDASEPDKSAQLRFVLLLCVGVEGSALGDQRGRAGNAVCRTVGSSASAAAIVHQQCPTPLRAVGRVPLAPFVFWSRSGGPCPSAVSGLDESNSMNRAKQVAKSKIADRVLHNPSTRGPWCHARYPRTG